MNTPAHLILAAAVFARPDRRGVNAAALAGGLLPDLSLYLMVSWALYVQGHAPRVVFGEMYFSDRWQAVFAVDNSLPLWALALGLALLLRSAAGIAFAGAGVLHLVADFLLHHDDARRQFWPLSDWVFQSPVSYWDGAHYGNIVGPAEILACLALSLLLWRRFAGWPARSLIAAGMALELAPLVVWGLMFAGG
ncbi:MAG: cobalamin biosynthesis protein CobQ [Gemmobacter sp.]